MWGRGRLPIYGARISQVVSFLQTEELELILWSCRMGGVSGPQLAKADVFSLGLSVYEAARLRRFFQASCSVNSSLYICAQVAQER